MAAPSAILSPLSIRRTLRRSQRRALLLIALTGVTAVLVAHHDIPMDMHAMSAGAVCVAILAVGTGLAMATAVAAAPRFWARAVDAVARSRAVSPRTVPTRAGPLHLQLLVIRR
jgi:hypothetical protein